MMVPQGILKKFHVLVVCILRPKFTLGIEKLKGLGKNHTLKFVSDRPMSESKERRAAHPPRVPAI